MKISIQNTLSDNNYVTATDFYKNKTDIYLMNNT